ncbi:conserved hypothetical protein [Talaromyces stipitatus ATCC 10500]|uniref:Uncharacterized protein n=1 Tax=Talaromyces stipitatus (strain ATCC 10500 / CBS 375.48 / QM 6759 / NRRL 1006) TaxID=441959 RepID=B8M8J4_TALSN|nr:uncharacterized protein TSTA_037280 [Talaromyces stipitatus ATCC 10500]EED20507.1 conserved hypothetical protein [Talaromyces stipitatus ATCC 10500]
MPPQPSKPPDDTAVAIHPVIQNALRVSLSAKEYKIIHERVLKRSLILDSRLPSPSTYESVVRTPNKYNVAAIRASLRVFLGVSGGISLVEALTARFGKGETSTKKSTREPFLHSPKYRLALSLSLVLLIHRILYRFFVRLRANLRTEDAKPFRDRNPRFSQALTSKYAPVVGASLAGAALGVCPQSRLRVTVAIYMTTRSLEFLYNALNVKGYLKYKPWWFGSWLLMPVSCAQLFHAFVFDRETMPKWMGDLLLRFSSSYIPERPENFPAHLSWPSQYGIVDSLGTIADLKWPIFISPILHPNNPNPLPKQTKSISPLASPAHPNIASLSCALLHPSTPGCSTAFIHHILNSAPSLVRSITLAALAVSAVNYKKSFSSPLSSINTISKRILSLTAILSASTGSFWGSICLLNSLLPRSTLPTKRFFISGAMGGLPFAFVEQGRGVFTYIFRSAIYSAWATGVKRRYWREWKTGELALIVVSWALIGMVLESTPEAVEGAGLRKGFAWLRGDGFADPVEVALKRKRRATMSAQKNTEEENSA